jgi:hypothetical protein
MAVKKPVEKMWKRRKSVEKVSLYGSFPQFPQACGKSKVENSSKFICSLQLGC